MTEEKKSSGAGKFVLGAAIGAFVGAIAGKFLSAKNKDTKCDGDKDCDCGCEDGDKKHGTKAKAK